MDLFGVLGFCFCFAFCFLPGRLPHGHPRQRPGPGKMISTKNQAAKGQSSADRKVIKT